MATYNYNLPDGRVLSFNQEATQDQLRQAMGMVGSVGELRRREGEGEIAAAAPAKERGFLDMLAATAPVNLNPTGFTLPVPSTMEEARGIAAANKEVLPFIAGMAAPGLLPARAAGGALANMARLGLESLIASSAAVGTEKGFDVLEGKPVGEAAAEAVLPIAVGTALGPPVAGLAKLGINFGLRSLSALSKLKGGADAFIADMMRRGAPLSGKELAGLKAREVIETATGVRIPVGLAEAIRTSPTSRRMLIPGNEVSVEELLPLEDLVLKTVANTAHSGRSTPEISAAVFDVLDPQRTGLNDSVKAAIENFAKKAIGTVNATEASLRGAGRFMFPAGRSAAQIGDDIGEEAFGAMRSAQADWDASFAAMRAMPETAQVRVDPGPIKALAAQSKLELVPGPGGTINVLADTGARKAVTGGETLPDTLTFEQAKSLVSELGKGIGRGDVLPGVDVRIKVQLAQVAKEQLEAALTQFPALQQALAGANKLYAENIGRFRGAFAEGILKDVGEEGGALPEAIIRSLTGKSAESNLNSFLGLLGEGKTAGASRVTQGLNLVREAVIANAAEAGRKGGGINIDKMFGVVDSLPVPVRERLFPDFKRFQDLFLASEDFAKGGIKGRTAQSILDEINIDPGTVQKALSSGDFTALKQAAELSIRQEQAARTTLKKLGLDELTQRDAFDILKFIKDPGNLPRLANLGTKLQSNPALHGEVKALFLDEIIENSVVGGAFDPTKFKDLIGLASRTTANAPGRQSGAFSDAARVFLGGGQRKALEEMADAIGDVPSAEATRLVAERSLVNKLVFGTPGGNPAQGSPSSKMAFVGRLLAEIPDIRYAVAAKFLTTQELRKAAMQPITLLRARDLNAAISGAAALLAEKHGKDSEIYRQARALEDLIP